MVKVMFGGQLSYATMVKKNEGNMSSCIDVTSTNLRTKNQLCTIAQIMIVVLITQMFWLEIYYMNFEKKSTWDTENKQKPCFKSTDL